MTTIAEGSLKFHFPDNCRVGKYDAWAFYRNQFQSVATGSKAIDMVCVTDDVCWLVEIKDYRKCRRSKPINIDKELATKVRDTLAGLASAAKNANDCKERELARQTLAGSRRWRVVLHLEQPSKRTEQSVWDTHRQSVWDGNRYGTPIAIGMGHHSNRYGTPAIGMGHPLLGNLKQSVWDTHRQSVWDTHSNRYGTPIAREPHICAGACPLSRLPPGIYHSRCHPIATFTNGLIRTWDRAQCH